MKENENLYVCLLSGDIQRESCQRYWLEDFFLSLSFADEKKSIYSNGYGKYFCFQSRSIHDYLTVRSPIPVAQRMCIHCEKAREMKNRESHWKMNFRANFHLNFISGEKAFTNFWGSLRSERKNDGGKSAKKNMGWIMYGHNSTVVEWLLLLLWEQKKLWNEKVPSRKTWKGLKSFQQFFR